MKQKKNTEQKYLISKKKHRTKILKHPSFKLFPDTPSPLSGTLSKICYDSSIEAPPTRSRRTRRSRRRIHLTPPRRRCLQALRERFASSIATRMGSSRWIRRQLLCFNCSRSLLVLFRSAVALDKEKASSWTRFLALVSWKIVFWWSRKLGFRQLIN